MHKTAIIFLMLLFLPLPLSAREEGMPFTYWSTDQHGDSVLLSGRIWVPKSGQAERILLCPHFTITGNSESPSQCNPGESCLASERYVLVMPDYLGYGSTVDRMHPYLDVHLTVKHTLDMLRDVRYYLALIQQQPKSDSIVIVGFSQGAAVAIGALEELERTGECPVKKCYASSGPYDVATLYDLCVEHDHIGQAFVIPAFIMGTSEAYGLNIHPDTIFTPWLLKRYEYALSKEHGTLAVALKLGKGKLSKYLNPAGMDKAQGEQKQLYAGYLRSSLVHIYGGDTIMSAWRPKTPIYLMHSTNDDLVDFQCAKNLQTMFNRNGATNIEYDFGRYGGHIQSMTRFFRKIKKELNR